MLKFTFFSSFLLVYLFCMIFITTLALEFKHINHEYIKQQAVHNINDLD